MKLSFLPKIARLFLPVIFLAASLSAFGQVSAIKKKELSNQIDSVIKSYVFKGEFTGVILVARDGKKIYENAFGLANREWNIDNTLLTKFRVGSITKSFVAVLIFQAIEKSLLRLDGRITDYLPDYPKRYGDQISISHLLSHTSGLIDIPEVPGLEWNKERLGHTKDEVLAYFRDQELKFTPGTNFHYSNFGYYLLSVILEKVTGQSYNSLLQQQIFTTAMMNNTSVAHNRIVLPNRASGYFKREGEYFNAPFFDQSIVQGCGDIISTADDLLAFDRALRNNELLSAKYQQVMYSPTLPEKNNYAYGWFVELPGNEGQPSWLRHSGSINGFSAVLVRVIDRNQTIILLCNTHGVQTIEISDAIRRLL
jgi:CubicO group peptidase (beta-lactamase class C family)